ncbi:MAG: rhomboid family intramembrane serine protease [Anaerolineales bacterium]|nr:rhomboid family intramembrane serine protease [Anaerolineales bacterium]
MDDSFQHLINCPNCNAQNYAGAAICGRCGAPLPTGDTPPPLPKPAYLPLPVNKGKPWLSWGLLAINIAVWLAMTAAGGSTDIQVLLKFGAKYGPAILDGEYWRLFTTMFLHIGIMHLAFNGYALYVLGPEVELFFGRIRFLVVYLSAGLISSAASYLFNSAPAAGASGAIFGMVGALAAYFYRNRKLLGNLGRRRLNQLVMVTVVNLIIGVTVPNIDNWAHIGGLIGGMLVGWALAPVYHVIPAGPYASPSVRDRNSLAKSWWIIPLSFILIAVLTLLGNYRQANSAITLLTSGEAYLYQGEYELAIQDFSIALQKDETLWPAYVYRGEAYMRQGNHKAAFQDFDTVIQLDSWMEVLPSAYSGRGRVYMLEGDPDKALDDLNFAVSLDYDNAYFHFLRGMIYYELMQPESTGDELRLALELGLDEPQLVNAAKKVLEALEN